MGKKNKTGIVFFDGVCHLCTGSVQFLLKRDRNGRFLFSPLQSGFGQSRIFALTGKFPDPEPQTIFYQEGDRLYEKSEAVLRIFYRLGFPWSLMMIFLLVPHFLRNRIYDFIAAHRYGWFGKKDRCMIPSEEIRHRFLE